MSTAPHIVTPLSSVAGRTTEIVYQLTPTTASSLSCLASHPPPWEKKILVAPVRIHKSAGHLAPLKKVNHVTQALSSIRQGRLPRGVDLAASRSNTQRYGCISAAVLVRTEGGEGRQWHLRGSFLSRHRPRPHTSLRLGIRPVFDSAFLRSG